MNSKANPTAVLLGGLFVVLATMVAYVYCAERNIETGPLLAIVGPVIAGLLLQQSIARVETQARQAVENTNGKLDGGIRDAVAAELNAQLDARGIHRTTYQTNGGPSESMTTAGDPTQPR
jgi:hypothetical protein